MSEHFTLLKDFENRPKDFKDVKVLSGYIMHLSDFGGTGKKTNISIQWSARVN
jgi:calcium/calmodulin-dependent 3',5'-cyclic nucleotide phosphodiesterase